MVDVLSMRWGSAAQCLVFLACLLSTCESTPKDYQRQQLLPVPPPPQSTESSDQFIEIFNKILQGFQDKDPGNFDGMNWYFGDTTDPVPEIPKLPQPHEELEDLPKYLPTFEPRDAWQKTAVPTVYIDGSFYNSTVTSSSFIAVAIAIVVILIISIVVTIYAIKARKRGIIVMTIRRSLQRSGDLFPSVNDSDRSLLVRPAPIVYVEDGRIRTAPSSGPEPPPYTEHHESLLPSELPPPYTETPDDSSESIEDLSETSMSMQRERNSEVV